MLALSLADVLRDSLALADLPMLSLIDSLAEVLTDSLSLAESLKLTDILVEILCRKLSKIEVEASASLNFSDADVTALLLSP